MSDEQEEYKQNWIDAALDKAKFIGNGLNDAIVKPITNDFRDAYWLQRAARAKYPASDAVTNFVPYVGAAVNADDIVRDIADKKYSEIPGDVVGTAVGVASTLKAGKAIGAIAKEAQRMGRSGGKVTVMGVGGPAALYAKHYIDAQNEADEKYEGRDLKDIADELRSGAGARSENAELSEYRESWESEK